MRKKSVLFLLIPVLLSCGGPDKKAQVYLDKATEAFARSEYSEAKRMIDSVRILYPKAFKVRKEGIKLMQQVEKKEQQENLVYLDSLLTVKQEEFEAIRGKFIFEKNEEYQDMGNYVFPLQRVEQNLNRSYLKVQVAENGVMRLTTLYCGTYFIHHNAIKVSVADGSFAESPYIKDVYETTNLDQKIEMGDLKLGEDGNVIGFIHLYKDNNIKVEYLGERKFTTNMLPVDRQAISELYELSGILSAMEQIKKEMKEARLRIEFIDKNMERAGNNGE
ncbi:MAG: hypothetical protein LUD15_13400 [Bacteroides sp.]|nr:hypothetical protein [Bacteroides sp.]